MRARLFALLVAAGGLFGPSVPSPAAPPPGKGGAVSGATHIEPGRRIGKVSLGSTRTRVHGILGRPSRSSVRADGLREEIWRGASGRTRSMHWFSVLFKDDRAVELEATSPAFKTPAGLSTATTFARLVKSLPELRVSQFVLNDGDGTCVLYYDDVAKGLAFAWSGHDEVLPGSRPESVIVHAPGSRAATPPDSRPVRPPDLDKTGAPFPYTRVETLGKTEAQILAMGRDAWAEFFTSGGSRDVSYSVQSEAQEIFGAALERRNRLRIARLPNERQRLLWEIRASLAKFETAAIEALASVSGGGATWQPVRAGVDADVEEVIGRLTGDRGPAPPARRTGDVERHLNELERDLRAAKADRLRPAGEPYSAAYGLEHLQRARATFRELAALLKKVPRAESDLVLGACIETLEGTGKPFGALPPRHQHPGSRTCILYAGSLAVGITG